MTPRGHHQKIHFSNFSTRDPIFDLKVSSDRVLQDPNLCPRGHHQKIPIIY